MEASRVQPGNSTFRLRLSSPFGFSRSGSRALWRDGRVGRPVAGESRPYLRGRSCFSYSS